MVAGRTDGRGAEVRAAGGSQVPSPAARRPGLQDELADAVLGTLPPTARRLLQAAHRVLERDGYDALTLRRIAVEAGETKSLIIYHFGNKAGLLATLVDSLWHDADVALAAEVERVGPDPLARFRALADLHQRNAMDPSLNRTFCELLPHLLLDDEARDRLAATYRSYRRIGELCVRGAVPADADALSLATLLLAASEGLALQRVIDPERARTAEAFAALQRVAALYLGFRSAEDALPASPPPVGDGRPVPRRGTGVRGAMPGRELPPSGERVLRAALRLLRRDGLKGVTVEALARQTGEPSSSVLYYFRDKQGLLTAMLTETDAAFAAPFLAAARGAATRRQAPGPAAAAHVLLAERAWMTPRTRLLPAVVRDATLRETAAAQLRRLVDELAGVITLAGSRAADAPVLATLAVGLTQGLAIQYLIDPDGTPVEGALSEWRRALAAAATVAGPVR
jgi:AcrR family transcriptional regulator